MIFKRKMKNIIYLKILFIKKLKFLKMINNYLLRKNYPKRQNIKALYLQKQEIYKINYEKLIKERKN